MSHRILLLGGHGRVALNMTTEFLRRSWQVTSIIRNSEQTNDIEERAKSTPGKLDVLTRSLDDVTSEQHAKAIIDETTPDIVVWSAGAGGKGGASRTYAIDRDAARFFITASARTPCIKKFLMISWIGSRRGQASWWNEDDIARVNNTWNNVLPDFAKAKIDADECLVAMGEHRKDWQTICLRPGLIKDDPPTGKVMLTRTRATGSANAADIADIAARLLDSDESRGYYDLINGDEDAGEAVSRVLSEKIDDFQGEDLQAIVSKYKL